MLRAVPNITRRPVLTDAGPLVALSTTREERHAECLRSLRNLGGHMVTSWAAMAEAMHLAFRSAGWRGQETLWQLVADGWLAVTNPAQPYRCAELMARYRDLPMDLADATLIAIAEQEGHRRIFTLDADFFVYRLASGRALEVIP